MLHFSLWKLTERGEVKHKSVYFEEHELKITCNLSGTETAKWWHRFYAFLRLLRTRARNELSLLKPSVIEFYDGVNFWVVNVSDLSKNKSLTNPTA